MMWNSGNIFAAWALTHGTNDKSDGAELNVGCSSESLIWDQIHAQQQT